MAQFTFERLVPRGMVRFISDELDLSGVRTSVNAFIGRAIVGFILIFALASLIAAFILGLEFVLALIGGLIIAIIFLISMYVLLEFRIERRKNFVESILPEYLQLVSANIRSGISIDRAMIMARRSDFLFFSADIEVMNKQLYSGETMQNAMNNLAKKYRSIQLQHTVRMVLEAVRYGGALADLLNQIAKDVRSQQILQKEISSQLFMYTIFISFAAVAAAPALYGLTYQMITITDRVWAGILAQNPGGLPSTGISFLKPSAPQVSPQTYFDFALVAILMITSFGSLIVSTISSGSAIKGIRYLPIFVILGLVIFYVVFNVMGGIFSSIGSV